MTNVNTDDYFLREYAPQWFVPQNVELEPGAYILLINHFPLLYGSLIGTLRIEKHQENGKMIASGDLYASFEANLFEKWILTDQREGIPGFDAMDYRMYFQVKKIFRSPGEENIQRLQFNLIKYANNPFESLWRKLENQFICELHSNLVKEKRIKELRYWYGPIFTKFDKRRAKKRSNNCSIGNLTLKKIATHFRKATIQIYMTEDIEFPLKVKNSPDLQTIYYNEVKWRIGVCMHRIALQNEVLSVAEIHKLMHDAYINSENSHKFIARLICVPEISDNKFWGFMFDASSLDSNKIPREMAVIAYEKKFDDRFGSLKGQKLSKNPAAFFFVAVHELMHIFNLVHDGKDKSGHFMRELAPIVLNEIDGQRFPYNIKYKLTEKDQEKLKHYPDIFVRPGGSIFCETERDAYEDASEDELELVIGGHDNVPIGCPVRLELQVINRSNSDITLPKFLNSNSIRFWGDVVPKSAAKPCRRFKKILYSTNPGEQICLKKDQMHKLYVTLLHGISEPLFPEPGEYWISITLFFDLEKPLKVSCKRPNFEIKELRSPEAKKIAEKILANPEVQLFDLIRGDGFPEAKILVEQARKFYELEPYYTITETKRLLERYFDRPKNPRKALEIIYNSRLIKDNYSDYNDFKLYLNTASQDAIESARNEVNLSEFSKDLIRPEISLESAKSLVMDKPPFGFVYKKYIRKIVKVFEDELQITKDNSYAEMLGEISKLVEASED